MSHDQVVQALGNIVTPDLAEIRTCIAEAQARLTAALPAHQHIIADAFAGVHNLLSTSRSATNYAGFDRQVVSQQADLDQKGKFLPQVAAEKARQRLEYLVEVSAVLSSSLEFETILQKLAWLLVPSLADYCLVDVVEADGQIRRIGSAHATPEKEATIRLLEERYPPDPQMHYGVPVVLRTGVATLTETAEDWQLEAAARDQEHLQLLRELGPRSAIVLPLIVQDRTLGVLTLATTNDSGRHYNADDFVLGKELARRAALAIENARLYRDVSRAEQETRQQAARLHALAQASSAFAAARLDNY